MATTRREFLWRSLGAFGAAMLAVERFGLLNALAQSADYRALVCIFLNGGNDGGNMVIPYDDYSTYATARSPSGVAIPQESLLRTGVVPAAGAEFGFHPSLTGLHDLWNQGKIAVISNVGTLVEPTGRAAYINGTVRVPLNLFSHSDQINQWQTSISDSASSSGWGGRTADKIADANTSVFPPITSLSGTPVFTVGNLERPLAIATAPTRLDAALRLDGFPNPPDNDPRYLAMQDLLLLDQDKTLVRGAGRVTGEAVAMERAIRLLGDPTVSPFPLNLRTTLGNQLEQVAKVISVRNELGVSRQIFFCSLGGFDTHNGQVVGGAPTTGTHASLLLQVSDAMKAFYQATLQLGVASQVTTFTLSDFSRTWIPNGNLGTDHAWGSHQFVMGGSVIGGDFYGVAGSNGTVFPTLAANGPDDTDQGGNARGRWIPTVAIDQYGATLASWLGISTADLPAVFPNIARFNQSNLGFLGSAAKTHLL
jgi:uncharacterized protein (DUF1501 family)